MKLFCLLCLVCVMTALVCSDTAVAADNNAPDRFATARGVLVDPSGSLQFRDVLQREFTPYRTPYSQGSSRQPLWFHLTVPPQPGMQSAMELMIQPASIRDIRVYTHDQATGWHERRLGSQHPFRERERSTLSYTLDVPVSGSEPTDIYVRVDTHTSTIHAEVVTMEAARELDTRLHLVAGAYSGFALFLATLSLLLWWVTRDALWGISALFDMATVLHSAMMLGFVQKYLLPDAAGLLPSLFTLTATLHMTLCAILYALIVRTLNAPRWATWGYWAAIPAFIIWVIMIVGGELGETLIQMNQFTLMLTLWGILPILTIRPSDRWLARIYRGFTVGLIVYLLFWILPIVNSGQGGMLSLYPTLPTNLVSMVMVASILTRRTVLALSERNRLRQEAAEAQNRFELAQAHHAETEGLLGMIMHEVKNPLASIRLASDLLSSDSVRSPEEKEKRFRNIHDSVEAIDSILNCCIDMDRLERGMIQERRSVCDVADLLRQWVAEHPQRARIESLLPESLEARIDSHLLFLMLGNLVDNALKYSVAGSRVQLELWLSGDHVEIEVRNAVSGTGRPDPERLFQKYYRAAAAQSQVGTGLGLYWVKGISDLVGGSVTYEMREDVAVFLLRVPA